MGGFSRFCIFFYKILPKKLLFPEPFVAPGKPKEDPEISFFFFSPLHFEKNKVKFNWTINIKWQRKKQLPEKKLFL